MRSAASGDVSSAEIDTGAATASPDSTRPLPVSAATPSDLASVARAGAPTAAETSANSSALAGGPDGEPAAALAAPADPESEPDAAREDLVPDFSSSQCSGHSASGGVFDALHETTSSVSASRHLYLSSSVTHQPDVLGETLKFSVPWSAS